MSVRDYSKRIQSFRSRDSRRKYQETTSDSVPLDLSQDVSQLLKEIFCSLSNRKGVSTGRNLGHLNNLIKILCYFDNVVSYYSLEEIFVCLKPALVSDVKEVRAACIRAIRYLINDSYSVSLLTTLHLDCLIIKCLDISHFNEVERIQCLRLIRKILHIAKLERRSSTNKECIIPKSFVSCIIAISCDGAEERDRVYRTCLAVLCELVVLEPALVIESGGLLVLLRAILECHMYQRINESLCMCLALLLNHPLSRSILNLEFNFNAIFAPYTDIMYRLHVDIEESQIREEQEMRYLASKMAIVSILHTWSGLVHLGQSSALQAFLSTLSIPNSATNRATLSVLYEVFCFSEPKWTDDFAEAFESIGPKLFQESWRLTNQFAAAEGKFFLPPNCNPRPDLINCYMAVLLSIYIRDNLIQHLVEVVLSTDAHASISACILLGAILHLCSKLLPNSTLVKNNTDLDKGAVSDELFQTSSISAFRECLPELMKKATSSTCSREEKLRAGVAVCRLQEVHNFFNKRAAPSSIYLNELLFRVKTYKVLKNKHKSKDTTSQARSEPSNNRGHTLDTDDYIDSSPIMKRNRSITILRDFSDDQLLTKIKETQVLVMKDHNSWKWDVVSSLLAESWSRNTSAATSLQYVGSDDTVQRFVKRLVTFFLPSSENFSKLEQAREGFIDHNRSCIQAGCNLMRFLATSDEEGLKILNSFTEEIVQHLSKLILDTDGPTKVTNLFSTTCAREYFLLLGALTTQRRGNDILKQNKAFELFLKLTNEKTHESLIKLIVSSLFYTNDSSSYQFLKKVLVNCNEASRIYATSYLRVLLRAEAPNFITWGINLLITQLYDPSNSVAAEALDVLNEACDDPKFLHAVVNVRPSVLHLGEPGALLVCRFMSHPAGFDYLTANKYLRRELDRWWDSANERYVTRVEELLNLSLTCYEKPNQQGGFVRRSGIKKKITPVPLPSHIYGELCRHKKGCEILDEEKIVPRLMRKLEECLKMHEENFKTSETPVVDFSSYQRISECLAKIKSCLWALAHIGSSSQGLDLLRPYGTIEMLTELAQHSAVHSICGTCFYCLSIISQTVSGTEELRGYGWLSVSRKAWSATDLEPSTVASPVFKSSSWSISSTKSKAGSRQSIPRSMSLQPNVSSPDAYLESISAGGRRHLKNAGTSQASISEEKSIGDSSWNTSRKSRDSVKNSTSSMTDSSEKFTSSSQSFTSPTSRNFNNSGQSEHKCADTESTQKIPDDKTLSTLDTGGKIPTIIEPARRDALTLPQGQNISVPHLETAGKSNVTSNTSRDNEKTYLSCSLPDRFSRSAPDIVRETNSKEKELSSQDKELLNKSSVEVSVDSTVIKLEEENCVSEDLNSTENSAMELQQRKIDFVDEPKQDWCFNKLMGLSAIETIRERQCKRKMSIIDYDAQQEGSDNWLTNVITEEIRDQIEQSMSFVGIALPEDLDVLFKHKKVNVESPTPQVALIPARIRHKQFSSKQDKNPFAAFSTEEPYSSASVRSDTTSFLDDVRSASIENSTDIIHQEIVKLVMSLGSSVGVKMNETALLVMKEKFPELFDSTTLYYNVSKMMAEYNFRITTRRFIQELFHDVALTEVYQEAKRVLERQRSMT